MLYSGARILIIFSVLMSIGCSLINIERKVVPENVFISSRYPDIKVDEDLIYIGKATSSKNSKFNTAPGGSNATFESHLFGEVDENNKIQKSVIIRFLKIGKGYWLPDNFTAVRHMLESGIVDVKGKNYQYAVFPDTSPFIDYEEMFLFDNGYVVPNCFIVKALARREGVDNNHKYYVAYLEAANTILDRKYRCKDWTRRNKLVSEQREFLISITENYNQCIEIGCDYQGGVD